MFPRIQLDIKNALLFYTWFEYCFSLLNVTLTS